MDYPKLYDICGIMDPYETVAIIRNGELLYQGPASKVAQGRAIDFDDEIISDSTVYELTIRRVDVEFKID